MQTEENFRKVISTVEGIGKCVILIDEIEKALNRSAVSGSGDSGTSSRSFGSLLTWFNDRKSPAFIIGTSNNFLILPPELLRKGRFDDMFWLDLPQSDERQEILSVVLKKYQRDPAKFNIKVLAKSAHGFSGAELDQAVLGALFQAYSKDREVTTEDIAEQIDETHPLSETMKDDLDKMRAEAKNKLRIAVEDGSEEIEESRPHRNIEA